MDLVNIEILANLSQINTQSRLEKLGKLEVGEINYLSCEQEEAKHEEGETAIILPKVTHMERQAMAITQLTSPNVDSLEITEDVVPLRVQLPTTNQVSPISSPIWIK